MSKPLPDVDLSSAFAKPSRAAGIKLPPAKKATPGARTAPQRPVSPVPDPEPAPDSEGSQNASASSQEAPEITKAAKTAPAARPPAKRAGRSTAANPARATTSTPRPAAGQGRLVLWTPVTIRARMQAVQAQRGALYLDQVLDALEATVDRLPELVAQATSTPHVQGKLFERAITTAVETGPAQRVQLTIRGLLDSQLAVIDQLVESSGAPSRSALINAALDETLPR